MVFPTAEVHARAWQLQWSGDWLLKGYDPQQTAVADAVAETGMVPDLTVCCEKGHVLAEGWLMPDGRGVVRVHQAGVSQDWAAELTSENGANRSSRFAAASGVKWVGRADPPDDPKPTTVGFVWQTPGDSPVSALPASCRCAQRWPFWLGPTGLWEELHRGQLVRLVLPVPDRCDCAECALAP